MARSRRAFIAAPLVGTMIFLICLMIVVSLGRSEANRVNNVVSGAYHNRLASVVETYRSDLGVNFNTGLQRMIEYGLTSECWFNFANVKTERVYDTEQAAADDVADGKLEYLKSVQKYIESGQNQDDETNLKTVTEAEERFFSCNRINSILGQITCPCGGGSYGLPEWVNSIKGGTAENPAVSFEGIKLDLLPDDVVARFGCGSNQYSGLCQAMVSGIQFDCRDFALRGKPTAPTAAYDGVYDDPGKRPFQCCKYDPANLENGVPKQDCTAGPGNEKIIGCGTGTMFVGIDIESENVYPYMPRIQANDSSGNVIRAGAISDRDFSAPVTYPLFKYMDAAFYFNRRIAFGADAKKGDLDSPSFKRGIFSGTCLGADDGSGTGCSNDLIDDGPAAPLDDMAASVFGTDAPNEDSAAIENSLSEQFFESVVNVSCLKVHNTYATPNDPDHELGVSDIDTLFCAPPSNCVPVERIAINVATNWKECGAVEKLNLPTDPLVWKKDLFGVNSAACQSAAPTRYCAFIQRTPSTKLLFIDNNPAVRVDPSSPNQFCWYSSVSYKGTG